MGLSDAVDDACVELSRVSLGVGVTGVVDF